MLYPKQAGENISAYCQTVIYSCALFYFVSESEISSLHIQEKTEGTAWHWAGRPSEAQLRSSGPDKGKQAEDLQKGRAHSSESDVKPYILQDMN